MTHLSFMCITLTILFRLSYLITVIVFYELMIIIPVIIVSQLFQCQATEYTVALLL